MFRFIRSLSARELLAEELPALAGAFVIAETFYKFHSFALECGAFLATWYVMSAGVEGLRRLFRR